MGERMELNQHRIPSPGWDCVHCTAIGASHVQEGIVCQDKTFALTQNGVSAFALADGAGSARLSHFGAQTVTETVCALLCGSFEELYAMPSPVEAKKRILECLLEALKQTAAEHGCGLPELASTLLAVAVCGDRYMMMHVGDGVIGYVKDGELRVASAPSNGEFANTTTFVTSGGALQDMRIRKGESAAIKGFVLMSDGSEASLFSKKQQHLAPVLLRLICRLSITSAEYLTPKIQKSLDDVVSSKTRDDCSLVLAAKLERTYAQLSPEEQDAFFELDESQSQTVKNQRRRARFVTILDHLDRERSLEELTACLGLKGRKYAYKYWIRPLVELGYVVECGEDRFRKIVGKPADAPQADPNDKGDTQDE